jgi:hypothetical protein
MFVVLQKNTKRAPDSSKRLGNVSKKESAEVVLHAITVEGYVELTKRGLRKQARFLEAA